MSTRCGKEDVEYNAVTLCLSHKYLAKDLLRLYTGHELDHLLTLTANKIHRLELSIKPSHSLKTFVDSIFCYCQAQFQYSPSLVQLELRLAL